jgi:RecB family exonuclease
MQLSYSKISTFQDCGWRYKLRYVNKVPSKPKPYFRFGTVLHAVLGRFYLYPGEGRPSLDYMLSLFDERWPRLQNTAQPNRDKGEQILRSFYERNIEHWRPPVYAECVFDVPIGRHMVTGVFDRVDKLWDGQIEVIDYKTHTRVPTQEELDTDLQLSLYALAFEYISGRIPDVLSIYHLRENRKLSTTRSSEQLSEVRQMVLHTGDRICQRKGFAPKENDNCRWCDYVAYCPLKTEEPLKVYDQMELELTS